MTALPDAQASAPGGDSPSGGERPGPDRWSARHVYLHGGTAHTDAFLTECLAPAADRLAPNGWFFLRYWTGGPHVRIRLRDAGTAVWAELVEVMAAWLAAHPPPQPGPVPAEFYGARSGQAEHGWHPHASIIAAAYEPEVDRYGGPAVLTAAEELFVTASTIAIAAIRGSAAGPRRVGVAFNLFLTFARAVCDNDVAEVAMLRRYVYSARYNLSEAPSLDVVQLRAAAERDYHAAAERFQQTAATVDALVAEGSGSGYLGVWAARSAAYAEELRRQDSAGLLGGYGSLWAVLLSQLHMLMNRIGITLAEEYHLSWLCSLVRAGASVGAGFHDRGMSTPSRHYHEASKYFAVALAAQRPRSSPIQAERTSHWANELVLPAPNGLGPATLADMLAGRRSSLGRYSGPLAIEDLSTLLAVSAGEQRVSLASGEELPLRPYPTAGARHSTRVLVLPTNVAGLAPAIYEYRAGGHRLRPSAPAPRTADLAGCSPYLADGFDVESVPLWLFVAGDLSGIAGSYGARGYRLLLLEAGHLAQNLLLVATALGYQSVPVGGFYDDELGQLLDLDGVGSAPFYLIPMGKPGSADV